MRRFSALTESSRARLLSFGLLYLSQGIPVGFMTVTLYAWLAELGINAHTIGIAGLIAASPWTFKLLWGPVIDRYTGSNWGRRRPYVIGAQAGLVASALALTTISEPAESLYLLTGILFVQALFASVQDVAVDAMAIDVVPPKELGRTNGIMLVGKICGVAFGAGGLATILESFGLAGVAWTQFGVLGALLLVPLLIDERRASEQPGETTTPDAASSLSEEAPGPPLWRVLLQSLLARPSLTIILAVLGVAASHSCAMTAFEVYAVQELGYRQATLSRIISILGGAGALVGAGTAALIPRRLLFRLLALAALLLVLVSVAFGVAGPWWTNAVTVWAYAFADGAAIGMLLTGFHAVAMALCDTRVAATQFSVYMAVFNGSTALGRGLVGPVMAALGPIVPFFVVGLAAVLGIAVLYAIRIDRVMAEPDAVS